MAEAPSGSIFDAILSKRDGIIETTTSAAAEAIVALKDLVAAIAAFKERTNALAR